MKSTSPMMKAIRRRSRNQATLTFLQEIIVPSLVLFAVGNFLIYVALYDAVGK